MTSTADALVDRCRRLMTVRRTTVEEHEFAPIAAGDLLLGDRLIWGDRAYRVVGLGTPCEKYLGAVLADSDGSPWFRIDLLRLEEVFVLLPRPIPRHKDS